jgi:hypothetical protein
MSSSQHRTPDDVPAGWSELDRREANGIDVSLLWNRRDVVRVVVVDHQFLQHFHADVDGADALDAFHHPFAYVAEPDRQLPAAA